MPLVGVLAVALLAELLLDRVLVRMLHADLFFPRGPWRDALESVAVFSFHFTSALGVFVAAMAFVKQLADPDVLPRQPRGAGVVGLGFTAVSMLLFIVVATLGLWVRLEGRLGMYLALVGTYLACAFVIAALRDVPLRGRVKLWLATVAAAATIHAGWLVLVEARGEQALQLRWLVLLGEALAVTLAAIAPMVLLERGSPRALALVAGAIVAAGFSLLATLDWERAARATWHVFGLQLPYTRAGVVIYAVAGGALASTVTALLARRGPSRLRGWGLLLVALPGYRLVEPYQLCALIVGILCIVESYVRGRAATPSEAELRAALGRVAGALGTTEYVMTGAPGWETARISTSRDGEPVEVAVQRRAGAVARVEVVAGISPGDEAPPLSVQRRGGPRLGRREGVEVSTGDARFDAALAVHDARRLAGPDPILDDELRPLLLEAVDGWLGVWPGRCARLRGEEGMLAAAILDDAGPQELSAVVDLLVRVKRRGA